MIEIEPRKESYWIKLAELLHDKNETNEAITILSTAIEKCGKKASFYYTLSAYQFICEEKSNAICNLKTALSIDYSAHPMIFKVSPVLSGNTEISDIIETYKTKS